MEKEYEPAPPVHSTFQVLYICDGCGTRYLTYLKCDHLYACRNTNCNGVPWREGVKK